MVRWRLCKALLLSLLIVVTGCSSYRYYAGILKPLQEEFQGQGKEVADDGGVTYRQERLEISLRPTTSEELNRQFRDYSHDGVRSTNPYTFGDSEVFRTGDTPERFTVFHLRVENYQFPKVHIDPTQVHITTQNGRQYYALSFDQLYVYFRRYSGGGEGGDAAGTPGIAFGEWRSRLGLLRRTMFPDEFIFSAQDREGYIVFKPLAPDVSRLTVHIPNIVVRFDYAGDPVETTNVTAEFERDIGRIYADGRIEVRQ